MQKHKPERLILRVPKRLWLLRSKALAFCMTRNRVIAFLMVSVIYGIFVFVHHYYFSVPLLYWIFGATVWTIMFSGSILLVLPTIFIRKDCSECQFGFHIMTHERNHLLLNSSDEIVVEEETLKQTEDRLIPILLSNPKMCNDCVFLGRKMYCQATFNYLKKKTKERGRLFWMSMKDANYV